MDRDALIAAHMYIARAEAAKGYRKAPAIPYEDHASAAMLGLLKAVRAFDPGRGFVFKTLAGWYVRGEVNHQIRDWSRSMAGIPKELAGTVQTLSLDGIRNGEDGDGDTLLETLPDTAELAGGVLAGLDDARVREALQSLPPAHLAAVEAVYFAGLTWRDYGAGLGLSPSQRERLSREVRYAVKDALRASPALSDRIPYETARLPLAGGHTAMVDGCDMPRLVHFRWRRDARGFACRTEAKGRGRSHVRLHRVVVGTVPDGHRVIPRNGDYLDCRRSNLCVVPAWQAYHRQAARHGGSKGTYRHRVSTKWGAKITLEGKQSHLGLYGTEAAAAAAYETAARQLVLF
jgi:RNA polymerase sigma factor (sigma-70 family)